MKYRHWTLDDIERDSRREHLHLIHLTCNLSLSSYQILVLSPIQLNQAIPKTEMDTLILHLHSSAPFFSQLLKTFAKDASQQIPITA
jgi:hypothetical protein